MKLFLSNLKGVRVLLGNFEKHSLKSEKSARENARRSLVASQLIEKGAVIVESALTFKRPATGISPRELDRVLGAKARRDIEADTILQWKDLIEK